MSAFVARAVAQYEGPYPYIDGLIMQATQHIDRIQVEHLPRASGQSGYTLRRLVRLWLNLFVNFSAMPLRISVLAGVVVGLLGLMGSVAVVIEALLHAPPPGWASLMAGTFLLSGIQMVMLGIIGEYLGRLFLTVNRKPQALVREVVPPAVEAGAALFQPVREAG
jgi:undecaprenyl-phosphate 4-deoxy-4-formamido-L-arabinose transferase